MIAETTHSFARTLETRIRRQRADGMCLIEVETPTAIDLHLTLTPLEAETPAALAGRLAEAVNARAATVVRLIAFGRMDVQSAMRAALCQTLKDPDLPVIWVEGAACDDSAIAGIQVHAVARADVRTIKHGEKIIGRAWDDAAATHCVLSSSGKMHADTSSAMQTGEIFEKMQAGLALAGMTMKDVARTWFFLDGILAWYGDFNRVRNKFFEQCELLPSSVPASTGVGGRNPAGSALTAVVWALHPHKNNSGLVVYVPSPRQGSAMSYGSAFSRAVEIRSPGLRQLLVSGTASIAADGKTAHAGDVRAQIELTMRVAGDILAARGMNFGDISRATAYFKSAAAAQIFGDWLALHQLTTLPAVNVRCDICRDDLLFEIELDAIQALA